jgi:cobalamin biosynthesis protein CobT
MKLLILLVFFFGIILVVHGIYQEKFQKIKDNKKIEYRFVPRSYYDEQIFSSQFSSKFSNIFDENNDHTSANQRTFVPYKIGEESKDNYTSNELFKMFGSSYTKNGLDDESGVKNLLKEVRNMRESEFEKIFNKNNNNSNFIDVFGSNVSDLINKYYKNSSISKNNTDELVQVNDKDSDDDDEVENDDEDKEDDEIENDDEDEEEDEEEEDEDEDEEEESEEEEEDEDEDEEESDEED